MALVLVVRGEDDVVSFADGVEEVPENYRNNFSEKFNIIFLMKQKRKKKKVNIQQIEEEKLFFSDLSLPATL